MEPRFSYTLDPVRIAQRPISPADAAKLLVVYRNDGSIRETTFLALPELLNPNDLLVFNDSKVIPVRLFGALEPNDSEVEMLLLSEVERGRWRALGRPLKRLTPGSRVKFAAGLSANVGARLSEQEIELEFVDLSNIPPERATILAAGTMPIPPYIRRGVGDEQDRSDYQNVFAAVEGSIAAPTAGLHFTDRLLGKIRAVGCAVEFLTLHVGPYSFQPIEREDGELRTPGMERYCYSPEILAAIAATRARGGRVIAIGTTVVRALESMVAADPVASELTGAESETEIFIQPGYKFLAIDSLVTNFHQPRTTHLLLLQAILGRDLLEKSYTHALDNEFRFLSYGDGMIVL